MDNTECMNGETYFRTTWPILLWAYSDGRDSKGTGQFGKRASSKKLYKHVFVMTLLYKSHNSDNFGR